VITGEAIINSFIYCNSISVSKFIELSLSIKYVSFVQQTITKTGPKSLYLKCCG